MFNKKKKKMNIKANKKCFLCNKLMLLIGLYKFNIVLIYHAHRQVFFLTFKGGGLFRKLGLQVKKK